MTSRMRAHLNALNVFWDPEHIKLLLDLGMYALLEGRAAQQVEARARQQHIDGSLHGHAGQVGS